MNVMFNRYAIGVRAHADGIGFKQANVSSETVRGIAVHVSHPLGHGSFCSTVVMEQFG